MLHNFNMDQDITVIESEYDLQHFLENGYNVINYTESFDYSFPGGMFKNLIFSKYYLLAKWRKRSLVHLVLRLTSRAKRIKTSHMSILYLTEQPKIKV